MATTLRTPSWQLIGLTRSVPGLLEITPNHLSFTTDEGPVFRVPLSEVSDVRFPWYYFGGGVKFTARTARYRISFVRPNDAEDLSERLLARTQFGGPIALMTAGRKFSDIRKGRLIGKRWRAAFARMHRPKKKAL
jgi:hypothetical protein